MISITTVIHASTKHNRRTLLYKRLYCSGMNRLLITDFGSSTRGETHKYKSLSYHTMLTTSFNGRNPMAGTQLSYSMVQAQNPNCLVGPQLLTIMVGPQLQQSDIEADNPTTRLHGRELSSLYLNGRDSIVYLPGPLSTPNCLFFKSSNSQDHRFRHDVIHTPASFPIWGLSWQLRLSYPLRANVNCTQCYAPELRAE